LASGLFASLFPPVLTNRQEWFDLAVRPHVSAPDGTSELHEGERTTDMAFIPDLAAFKKSLDSLPVSTFEPGETVLAAGSTTGQLFILRQGVVEVVRDGLQIATVSEPGAVFGELSVILDKPHTADVRAVERSEFHVAKASSLIAEDVAALLYVSAILAQRLDTANEVIVEMKREMESGKRPGMLTKALEKLEKLLGPAGANTPDFPYYPFPIY
jgi:CRP/FNR family cyclic AMP-dependent transcriptional regulator